MSIGLTSGKWTFIYPIKNLVLTDAISNEIRLNRVTLITKRKFTRKCKYFGLPIFSKLTEDAQIKSFFSEIDAASTLAIMRESGVLKTATQKVESSISIELDILALSRLYSGNVRPLLGGTVASGVHGRREYLAIDSKSEKMIIGMEQNPARDLVLNESWNEWQKDFYFRPLIKCLEAKNQVHKEWKTTILRAVALVSEGLASTSSSFAFLHNMIALETLLIRSGDTHKVELPRRLQAFLGWSPIWDARNYQSNIVAIYQKRCLYVHDGNIETITDEDVQFTDHLLHNVFTIILCHTNVFPSKDALIEFCEKIAAERVLGIPAAKSKYLPKSVGITYTTI